MIDTKALREKILDLAIRGRLVPQDPNDEPASLLLDRIRVQKQQMVKEGKLKAKDIKNDTIIFKGEDNLHYEQFQNGTVKCIENEIPFETPESWAWARLRTISFDLPYGTSKKSSSNGKIAVLRMGNLQNGEIDYSDLVYSSDEEDIKKYSLIKGDLLFNRTNSIELVGKTSVYRGDIPAIYAGYLIRIRSSLNSEYLNTVMNSSYAREYCTSVRTDAVNQSNINAAKLGNILIAVPSISEQKRISKKTSESIKVINIIEQEKMDLQTMATNVKSKILDLAIRGKLVPQDPNDEPASVLLERIRAEKKELIKQGKIKRDKKESVIFKGEDNSYYEKIGNKYVCIDSEVPFDLPFGWIWCRGYSCFSGMETRHPDGKYFKYIDIDSIDNKVHKIKCPKVIATKDATSRANRCVKTGSVLFSFVRPYLKNIAYVDEKNKDCIASTGFYVCNSNGVLYPSFMYYLMISEYVVQGLNQFMKGDNSPSISKDNIENWLYPIPPHNEQKRICSKLEELIKLTLTVEKSLS